MSRYLSLLALLVATPAAAQDMPGAVDLGALGRTQVQSATARGYAERGADQEMVRSPNGTPLSRKSRAYCESVPDLRARYGAASPRVTRLEGLCRQAGYRY